MVIGSLMHKGVLKDIETPVGHWVSEFSSTSKKDITLRHILSHTSGLDSSSTPEEIYQSGNVEAFATQLDVVYKPGQRFEYSNAAVNILSAIVRAVTEKPMHEIANELIFEPMGIKRWDWKMDSCETPLSMSGCSLSGTDLHKIGCLMMSGGKYDGRVLFDQHWQKLSVKPCPPDSDQDLQHHLQGHGLLWWVLYPNTAELVIDDKTKAAWEAASPQIDKNIVARMNTLVREKPYQTDELLQLVKTNLRIGAKEDESAALTRWHENTWRRGLPDGRRIAGSEMGFYADGTGGQLLVVVPKHKLVAVQQVRQPTGAIGVNALVSEILKEIT